MRARVHMLVGPTFTQYPSGTSAQRSHSCNLAVALKKASEGGQTRNLRVILFQSKNTEIGVESFPVY